jgi:organic radical activating enzyme
MQINPSVFCNSPWYELHIFWNGDFGFCCQQADPPYQVEKPNPYNIKNMTINEWYDSQPMRDARLNMLKDTKWHNCRACYYEERVSNTSRRHRANQKSILFKKNFQSSFEQSPNYDRFYSSRLNGETNHPPVDLHIDLGNYCNLACKMCWSGASSKIATQEKQWGILENKDHLGNDWTKDQRTWDKFLQELIDIPIKNIHIMGGEPMFQPRFEELIDHLIANNKTNCGFSFVTNGTIYNNNLINKLTKFKRVNIEVSIETVTETNDYIRQGSKTEEVTDNIKKFKKNFIVTVRPVFSALAIRDFHTLLQFCLDNKLLMKASLVLRPKCLRVQILPKEIRQRYKQPYLKFIKELSNIDFNESAEDNYTQIVSVYAQQAIQLLDDDELPGIEDFVKHIKRWDLVYNYDAKKLYPELREILDKYGY